ncbi:MAG: sulfurtransferase-like selenium metabolism protein YedF [Deltaproteobacteria bacterium]|nr:sulfurtransferase-like selenium metabolism protein YedF [Deltaproteobacteria bacterium]
METLNCRGQSCPLPVMTTRNFVEAHPLESEFTVLVDNPAAAENVQKFLASRGFEVAEEPQGSDFQIKARKTEGAGCETVVQGLIGGETKTMVVITQDKLGTGDDQLGALLLLNFLKTLKEMGHSLWRLVFLNSGVKLTIEGAPALPAIQELSAAGVSVLVCGTCLNHFNLLERKKVGETTNMLDIVTGMQVAEKVISF